MEKTVKENNFANGSVKISNDIINRISAVACLETEGVASISGFSGDAVSGKIKKDFTKSVGVKINGNSEIDTQERLANLLEEEGFKVTQATISRDIKELQLVKILNVNGRYKYAVSTGHDTPISERFIKIFRETVLSFKSAQNLIIIKTLSGCGSAACEAIDCIDLPHLVGSVAGDNTSRIER